MVDEDRKQAMLERIEDGEFGPADLPAYMELFCAVAAESDDAQEEIEGWGCRFQVRLDGVEPFWLAIADGALTSGAGESDGCDVTLRAPAAAGAAILTGEKDATAAYMSGELGVDGELPHAVKLRSLIEIVRDELEE